MSNTKLVVKIVSQNIRFFNLEAAILVEYLKSKFSRALCLSWRLSPERPLEKQSLHIHKSHIELAGTVTDFVACL